MKTSADLAGIVPSICIVVLISGRSSANIGRNYSQLQTGHSNNTRSNLGTFIVGGVNATKNEFPWLVHLNIDGIFCGGAIIAGDLVLTAAHCIHKRSVSKIKVVAGDHHYSNYDGTEQNATAQATKWHENYNPKTFANDIGLIRLRKNLTLNSAVRPVELPSSSSNVTASVYGTVAGWGTTYSGGTQSKILLKVQVPIVNSTYCKRVYNDTTDMQFCAGEANKDSCQGDSGGPFICNRTVACGIVSYGTGCGVRLYPGVYTKVSSYIKWINKNRYISSSPGFHLSSSSSVTPTLILISILYPWLSQ